MDWCSERKPSCTSCHNGRLDRCCYWLILPAGYASEPARFWGFFGLEICQKKWMEDDWLVVWNMNFMTFHILGITLPFDFHIFQRGRRKTTNQMTSKMMQTSPWLCLKTGYPKIIPKSTGLSSLSLDPHGHAQTFPNRLWEVLTFQVLEIVCMAMVCMAMIFFATTFWSSRP